MGAFRAQILFRGNVPVQTPIGNVPRSRHAAPWLVEMFYIGRAYVRSRYVLLRASSQRASPNILDRYGLGPQLSNMTGQRRSLPHQLTARNVPCGWHLKCAAYSSEYEMVCSS